MDCAVCLGACCESITLNLQMDSDDMQRFLELRTKPVRIGAGYHRNFDVPCSALVEGRCGIYPSRPKVCRDFVPGGGSCLATVRARRTEEQYNAIKGADDPAWSTLVQG